MLSCFRIRCCAYSGTRDSRRERERQDRNLVGADKDVGWYMARLGIIHT